jgi:Protein of unknown function (DUF2809)
MTWSTNHTRVALSLLVVTPLGFVFKFYSGPGNGWFNNYGAGLLYEIFWILLAFFFFHSKRSANVIPVYVFLVTCILEFLQLWHPPFLEKIRSSFPGSALIGTTFVWWDFPHYVIGCFIGWIWIRFLLSREGK